LNAAAAAAGGGGVLTPASAIGSELLDRLQYENDFAFDVKPTMKHAHSIW